MAATELYVDNITETDASFKVWHFLQNLAQSSQNWNL